MGQDSFFNKRNCDRCGNALTSRIMSWFTEETICGDCSDNEDNIKKQMLAKDLDLGDYEGCGYVPDVKQLSGQF